MTKALTVQGEWRPSVQQEAAARYLAIGCTHQYTADRCGIKSLVTIHNWFKRREFADYVQLLRERAFDEVNPKIWQNVVLALELQRQVLAGEVPADDPRLPIADKLLSRFLDKLEPVVGDAPAGPPSAQPPVAIQFNVNGHHPD
jgi:hypothetical protein